MRIVLLTVLFSLAVCRGLAQECDAPRANNVTICAGSSAVLIALGGNGEYRWYDTITEGKLLATGAEFATPELVSTTSYYVEVVSENCISPRTEVTVTVGLKPIVSGATICAGSSATLQATGPGGNYEWYNAPEAGNLIHEGATFNTPVLDLNTTYYVQTSINGCVSSRTPVTVSVNTRHEAPLAAPVSICSGSSTILTANGPVGSVFQWFSTAEGGLPLITSPDYTTPALSESTTFYVQSFLNGCTSTRRAVTVTVTPIPDPPKVENQVICSGSTATLIAGGGDTYTWYAVPSRGNAIGTGERFITPALNRTTTYYVQISSNGCPSGRSPVTVTVITPPEPPLVTGQNGCVGSAVTLNASSPTADNYKWFDVSVGGTAIFEGSSFETPVLNSNRSYFVEASTSGCVSPRIQVDVALNIPPPAPKVADVIVCSGNPVTLTADSTIAEVEWYDAAVGGNLLMTGLQFATPPLTANTTYFAQATQFGCSSGRVPVQVTIKTVPPAPTVQNMIICPGTSSILTINNPISTFAGKPVEYYWFDAEGNQAGIGTTFTTPVLSASATYYAQAVVDGCSSAQSTAIVTVVTLPSRLFRYPSGTYCKDSRDPSPLRFTPLPGIFTAQPAGIVFKNPATGEIDLNASEVGSYVVTFMASVACPLSSTFELTITKNPNAEFHFEGPYCQGDTNPFATYPTGGSGGVFTLSKPGLFFSPEGSIDLQRTIPGTYIITNTIPANGGSCLVSAFSDTVVVLPAVQVNAGPDRTVSPGSEVPLAASVSFGSKFRWSGGNGTYTDNTSLSAVYTPAPGETNVLLILTAEGIAPCLTPKSDTLNIRVLLPPVAADQTICPGSSATLSVEQLTDVIYEWYDQPVGGSVILSNPTFITPILNSDKTYYVRALSGGIATPRVPVIVRVQNVLDAPNVTGADICASNTATLTAVGSGGILQWFDQAVGGNLINEGDTLITPLLKSSVTYFVQLVSGSCISNRTAVTAKVSPKPSVTSAALFTICDSTALDYRITVDQPGALIHWSRAAVPGIANEAVLDNTSTLISEVLNNTSAVSIDVRYVITPILEGCIGTPFDFIVTVDPSPVVTSLPKGQICNNSASDYTITYNLPGTNFNWSRAAVPGISNRSISGQRSPTIREVLTNTTNLPIDVTYVFNQSFDGCPGPVFYYVVTVNPSPQIISRSTTVICNKVPLNYAISSNINGAKYTWSRAEVAGISNASVSNISSSIINETLINATRNAITVTYSIMGVANGCPAPAYSLRVTVNPTLAPIIKSTPSVCVGGRIALSTTQVQGATYSWKGPNGFSSNNLNPIINQVTESNDGRYSLVMTVNGCLSDTAFACVEVVDPPIALAGTDQQVCASAPEIALKGKIGGGANSGAWTSSGSGSFQPSNTAVDATYVPSAQDRNSALIKLSLTATSSCGSSVSSIDITFEKAPVVNAGEDREVCSQNPLVLLNGKISLAQPVLWTSSGSGTFQPANTSVDASYVPSTADINKGSVLLTLSSAGTAICSPVKDDMLVKITPPPTVNAGNDFLLPQGRTIELKPSVNYTGVKYLWTPNVNLSDNTLKNPVLTGVSDQVYKLTVTDSRGCVTEDEVAVDVLLPVVAYNTFSPNGDGVNDLWNLPELKTYPGNTVSVFNRYGDKIFSSVGYGQAWDGTHNGAPAPVGTYYYVIDTKFPGLVYSGYVSIFR